MRVVIIIVTVLTLSVSIACGNQDQESTESKQAASIPKMDLHSAVYTNNLDVVRQHIAAGADLNVLEPSRASTPLITAAALGKTEAAKLLIDAGADLNYRNADGSTALHTAAVFGTTEVARLLIEAGADLNIQNNDGSTPLHAAAFFCRVEIVKMLLEKGADKTIENKMGQTPLQIVTPPFEYVKGVYDAVGNALKPLGLQLDYDRIKETRPIIAEMLK